METPLHVVLLHINGACRINKYIFKKAGGAWRLPHTPTSFKVTGRVELYLYSPSGPSWPFTFTPAISFKIPSMPTYPTKHANLSNQACQHIQPPFPSACMNSLNIYESPF
jgi:hypothetical protein